MIAQLAQDAVDQFAKLPIDLDDELPELGLPSLALRDDLSSYGAVYLELAGRSSMPPPLLHSTPPWSCQAGTSSNSHQDPQRDPAGTITLPQTVII